MNAHAKRWVTALIAGPLVVLLIIFGSSLLFTVFIALLIILSSIEYSRMSFGPAARSECVEGILLSLLIVAAAATEPGRYLAAAAAGAFVISILFFLLRNRSKVIDIAPLGKAVLGFIGLPLLIVHLLMIRNLSGGVVWIFYLFFICVAGDVSAFYVGRSLGKRKLMPAVSPGKTWAGAVGSVCGSLVVALIYKYLFIPDLGLGHTIILSCCANVLGQLGDLSESMIKRSSGAKDSGSIFPGHGGVLDRLDVFLFSAPLVYYYRVLLIG